MILKILPKRRGEFLLSDSFSMPVGGLDAPVPKSIEPYASHWITLGKPELSLSSLQQLLLFTWSGNARFRQLNRNDDHGKAEELKNVIAMRRGS